MSTQVRYGPDPRISIQARGHQAPHKEAGHTTASDHKPRPDQTNCLHQRGRPHTAMTKGGVAMTMWEVGDRPEI